MGRHTVQVGITIPASIQPTSSQPPTPPPPYPNPQYPNSPPCQPCPAFSSFHCRCTLCALSQCLLYPALMTKQKNSTFCQQHRATTIAVLAGQCHLQPWIVRVLLLRLLLLLWFAQLNQCYGCYLRWEVLVLLSMTSATVLYTIWYCSLCSALLVCLCCSVWLVLLY